MFEIGWNQERAFKHTAWILLALIVIGVIALLYVRPEKRVSESPSPEISAYVDGCIAHPDSCNGDFIIVARGEGEVIYRFVAGSVPDDSLGIGVSITHMMVNHLWLSSLKAHGKLGEIKSYVTLGYQPFGNTTTPDTYWSAAKKFYHRNGE